MIKQRERGQRRHTDTDLNGEGTEKTQQRQETVSLEKINRVKQQSVRQRMRRIRLTHNCLLNHCSKGNIMK